MVLARFVRNDRLADLCQLWAFAAISASPGARRWATAILVNRLQVVDHRRTDQQ